MKERINNETGAAAITVAICLLLLMGFAALALDGGLGFDDRRGTQNAADNAALAAAWEECNPRTGSPEAAGLTVAAQNGYDNNSDDTTVTVTELGDAEYEVTIETVNDTTFAAPGFGADTLTVTSRAIADCEEIPWDGGYAIFAAADSCSTGGAFELDLTGSTKTINGGIFSNGDLKINGPDTVVNGMVEFRGTYSSNANIPPEQVQQYFGSPKPYPFDLSFADYQDGGWVRSMFPSNFYDAGGAKIDNKWMVDGGYAVDGPTGPNQPKIIITEPGIYFTDQGGNNSITLQDVAVAPGVRVTFVSQGEISVVGKTDIAGFAPVSPTALTSVLMFSNRGNPPACNQNAISFSGSDMTWTGLIFAPNGSVDMSASSNVTVQGSIFGHSVNISGSNFSITRQDDPGAIPQFRVELRE